ncbi:MAG: hypothetical protein AVDCRST_MAG02-1451 [uncultured Rubrobacteraceae bacterium]|uniref:Uncharacterized protein n=1 Tax=uncultured Rubrobacteraceae bacterium TaxID=349277 RepID=A0A6J4R3T4_9ACTN|nr:MAG: hypothetical protein AVDCRST_MAG02-1451 [uncultured Rubrobacteraceae bacterium]
MRDRAGVRSVIAHYPPERVEGLFRELSPHRIMGGLHNSASLLLGYQTLAGL